MIRSLSTAVTGLASHQDKMDVVGNNIANVNTTAFKNDHARFQDLISQTIGGATAPLEDRGGVNPNQVGLGTQLGATVTDHTQGAIETTGRATDLAIEGEGFFIVSDGQVDYHTRDGSFDIDSNRELVNSDGMKVMGWMDDDPDPTDELEPLRIPLGEGMEAQASSNLGFSGNLDADAEDGEEHSIEYYLFDSLGRRHDIEITFTKNGENGENEWDYDIELIDDNDNGNSIGDGTLTFGEDGQLDIDEDDEDDEHGVTYDPDDADEIEVDLDFSNLTQLASESVIEVETHDGFGAGELVSFEVEESGAVRGTYTNGMREVLGHVAMSTFANPEGLSKEGGNLFEETANSGEASIGLPGQQGRGVIQDSALEMSNADLAEEFTELVTTSRGFQANTRVISSSDEILTEVINMQR